MRVGEWHTVAVERDPEYPDDLEYITLHPDECPWELGYSGMVRIYLCDVGWEVENNGPNAFDITEPGTYRARVRISPGDLEYGPEPEMEVEKIA